MTQQVEIDKTIPLCQLYSRLVRRFGEGECVWVLRCKKTNRFFAQLSEDYDANRFDLFSAGVLKKDQAEMPPKDSINGY